MAHGGGDVKISEDELAAIGKAFEEMGIKPSATSAKEFQKWLTGYGKGGATSKGDKSKSADQDGSSGHGPGFGIKEHPRLPNFSGDKKSDGDFDLWRYQVQCLMQEQYSEAVILLAIRRSLKGEAARVVMRLGSQANISDILNKFESIYGLVDKKQILMSKFYSAKQDVNEDVTSWGCRLEDMLSKVRAISTIPQGEAENMLKDMFWEGLKPSLKDATGHIYDKGLPFDELRKAIRIKEEDQKKRDEKKKEYSNSVTTSGKSEIDELKDMIQNMNTEMKQMKEELSTSTMDNTDQYVNSQQHFNANSYGHYGHYRQRGYYGRNYRRGYNGRRSRGQGFGRGFTQQQQHQDETADYMHTTPRYTENGDPICMRCGQEGHIALGCRVRLDHQKKNLNFSGPTSRRGR